MVTRYFLEFELTGVCFDRSIDTAAPITNTDKTIEDNVIACDKGNSVIGVFVCNTEMSPFEILHKVSSHDFILTF